MINIHCSCGESYHSDEQHIGKKIVCNRCGQIIVIKPQTTLPFQSENQSVSNAPESNSSKFKDSTKSYKQADFNNEHILKGYLKQYWQYILLLFLIVGLGGGVSYLKNNNESPNTPKSVQPDVLDIENKSAESISIDNSTQESRISYTKTYSIGFIDPRFNISKDKLLKLVCEAEEILEKPFDKSFFKYNEHSLFKINLIYDERQKIYEEGKQLSSTLQKQNKSYNELITDYETLKDRVKIYQRQYEEKYSTLKNKMSSYEKRIDYWNSKGGAPDYEYSNLQRERELLNNEANNIDKERIVLNNMIGEQNDLLALVNEYASKYNFEVESYNGKYVKKREFEKGSYKGYEINIYQYRNYSDLRFAIAHELGHAIGLDHAKDPKSLMYPFLEKQNIIDFQLTNEDKELIKNTFIFKQLSF